MDESDLFATAGIRARLEHNRHGCARRHLGRRLDLEHALQRVTR